MKLSTILVAVVATVATHSAMASDFYRWVDKNGTTHYTQTPPPKGAKLVGKTETYSVPTYQKPVHVQTTSTATTSVAPSTPATSTSAPRNLAASLPADSYNYTSPTVAPSSNTPASTSQPAPRPLPVSAGQVELWLE